MIGAYAHLLSTAPGSCGSVRKELENIHGLKIAGSSYQAVRRSLVDYFGFEGAIKVVEDIVDISTARKALVKVMGKRQKGMVDAMLMERINKATKRGRLNLRKTQLAATNDNERVPRKTRRRIINHDHIQLPSVEYGRGYSRAIAISYRAIERITDTGCSKLKARSNWLEWNLENYIESHWTELDFGLGRELRLEGRQVGLSDTKEKVDLLAKMGDVFIPIELKIKRANGSDLTQLQSYRQDVIKRGVAAENVLGILVAPKFSSKVLNAVTGIPGIILRWFEMPM